MLRFLSIVFFLCSPFAQAQTIKSEKLLVIEDIRCVGNTHTDCGFLRDLLPFKLGEVLDDKKVKNARLQLSTFSFIKNVSIVLEKGQKDSSVIVVLKIVENSPLLFSLHLKGVYGKPDLQSEFGVRLENQNFLGQGKNISFSAGAFSVPNNGRDSNYSYLRLRYIDPNLFGSADYFLSSYAGYLQNKLTTEENDLRRSHSTDFNFALGRRLGDFSYAAIGYRWFGNRKFELSDRNNDGFFRFSSTDVGVSLPNGKLNGSLDSIDNVYFAIGWNTEDDPYFPTVGSRLNLTWQVQTAEGNDDEVFFSYKRNWSQKNNTWSIHIDTPSQRAADNPGDPTLLSRIRPLPRKGYLASFSRPLPQTGIFSDFARKQWTVDVGYVEQLGYDGLSPSIGFSLRVDHEHFGIINFDARYIRTD